MDLFIQLPPPISFPFRHLPAEIRDKIYTILLCTFEAQYLSSEESHERNLAASDAPLLPEYHTVPTATTRLRHSVEPQILRTCRAIYQEAVYLMRKTNCFIKIVVRTAWEDIHNIFVMKRIPILVLDRPKVKDFKDCIVSHEITSPVQEKARTFIILRRDLDMFCKGLADYKHTILRHDEMISHIVTLLDPYESEKLPQLPEFYTLKLQESLIAPYRKLRGFPRFAIKGVIPKDLSRAAVREITRSPDADPDSLISELEALKLKGNDFFRNGNGTMASEMWCQGIMRMHRLMSGKEWDQMHEAGGISFVNHIAALTFDLNSNRAQNTLKAMRDSIQRRDMNTLYGLEGNLLHAVEGARDFEIPGSTWEPSPRQAGKLSYREAVGYRLLGQFHEAKTAIDTAISHLPDDDELKNEKQRIMQAMK